MNAKTLYWMDNFGNFFEQAVEKIIDGCYKLVNRKRPIPCALVDSEKPFYGNCYFSSEQKLKDYDESIIPF